MSLRSVHVGSVETNPPVVFLEVFDPISEEMADRKALYLTLINSYLSCLGIPD